MLVLFRCSKDHNSTGWGTDQACGDQAILCRLGFLLLIMAAVKTVKHLSAYHSFNKRKIANCCRLS